MMFVLALSSVWAKERLAPSIRPDTSVVILSRRSVATSKRSPRSRTVLSMRVNIELPARSRRSATSAAVISSRSVIVVAGRIELLEDARRGALELRGHLGRSLAQLIAQQARCVVELREELRRGAFELSGQPVGGLGKLRTKIVGGAVQLREQLCRGAFELRGQAARCLVELRGEQASKCHAGPWPGRRRPVRRSR